MLHSCKDPDKTVSTTALQTGVFGAWGLSGIRSPRSRDFDSLPEHWVMSSGTPTGNHPGCIGCLCLINTEKAFYFCLRCKATLKKSTTGSHPFVFEETCLKFHHPWFVVRGTILASIYFVPPSVR